MTLRIALVGYWPEIWRTFRVYSATPLSTLHTVIQDVMGWSDRHLHEFSTAYECFDGGDKSSDDEIDTSSLPLTKFFRGPGDELEYEYDFGDGWRHRIVATTFEMGSLKRPECLDGAGCCPPEDVGGVHGYRGLLDAIADPKHRQHRYWLEKVGTGFGPTKFCLQEINARLERRRFLARADVGHDVARVSTTP